jgi:hypothetical protein
MLWRISAVVLSLILLIAMAANPVLPSIADNRPHHEGPQTGSPANFPDDLRMDKDVGDLARTPNSPTVGAVVFDSEIVVIPTGRLRIPVIPIQDYKHTISQQQHVFRI